jgi:hypothetical protein
MKLLKIISVNFDVNRPTTTRNHISIYTYLYSAPVKYLTSNRNTVAVVQQPFMEGSIPNSPVEQVR